jgi:hypothetical protein
MGPMTGSSDATHVLTRIDLLTVRCGYFQVAVDGSGNWRDGAWRSWGAEAGDASTQLWRPLADFHEAFVEGDLDPSGSGVHFVASVGGLGQIEGVRVRFETLDIELSLPFLTAGDEVLLVHVPSYPGVAKFTVAGRVRPLEYRLDFRRRFAGSESPLSGGLDHHLPGRQAGWIDP